jgi:single-strand DNA-binding protein
MRGNRARLSTAAAGGVAGAFPVRDCGARGGNEPPAPAGAPCRAPATRNREVEMINDAQVFLSGYVATDPTFKRLNGKTSTAKLRIAYTARRMNRETGEWSDGPTSFLTVQCWRTLAENVAVCLRKGEPVLVKGRLQVRKYESNDGGTRLAVEVDASSIGYDLNRGVAHFSRTHRAAGGTATENGPSAAASGEDGEGSAEPGGQPDVSLGATPASEGPSGGNVIDERAVAEFARELSESLASDHETSEPEAADRHQNVPS